MYNFHPRPVFELTYHKLEKVVMTFFFLCLSGKFFKVFVANRISYLRFTLSHKFVLKSRKVPNFRFSV